MFALGSSSTAFGVVCAEGVVAAAGRPKVGKRDVARWKKPGSRGGTTLGLGVVTGGGVCTAMTGGATTGGGAPMGGATGAGVVVTSTTGRIDGCAVVSTGRANS